jgi:hypothetical protein
MIFGWASSQAAGQAADAPFAGLFRAGPRADGAVIVAPSTMDARVGDFTWALHDALGTYCVSNSGATNPSSMANAQAFVASRAPGVMVDVQYDGWMTPQDGLRDAVIDALCDGRPSIVGIGTLFGADLHYPVAKAYNNGWFWLEMGWGGTGDAWHQASTWFMGTVRH